MQPRIAYFVHNLADPAVLRRVRMLHAGGAEVIVVGFRRGAAAPSQLDGAPTLDLGRTVDARLGQRILSVLKNAAADRAIREAIAGATVVMARNLEMLVLAAKLKRGRRLVYECLDIHRLLLTSSLFARIIQRIERALLKHVNLIVTSSPRFEIDYFRQQRGLATRVLLLENKVLRLEGTPAVVSPSGLALEPGKPIVIGWFGMLRCRRTLEILARLAARSNGRVLVHIAGIPSEAEFPDFEAEVSSCPGLTYSGPYRAEDLAALYARIHYIWAIDFFEEGLNSTWLLPNRLYEALDNGAVPIALRAVETGRWLQAAGVGLVIDDPEAELPAYLDQVTASEYQRLRAEISTLPRSRLQTTRADCAALVEALVGADQK